MSTHPTTPGSHWAALSEIASRQHGAFSTSQAAELPITSRQLLAAERKGLLRRPLSDVFTFASTPITHRQRLMIASLAGGVISHDSSALLHRLDGLPPESHTRIHVCFPRNHKRALPGYVVHTWRHTDPRDITEVDGIRCTSIARTLVQLGLNHGRSVVELALDSALRSGASPEWIKQTLDRLVRAGPTGQHVLAEITSDPARSGVITESMLETLVESALADPTLPAPVRQFEVQLESGPRRFDLAFPTAKLAIEAHSRRFHFGQGPEEADNLRDIELAAAGWEVLYITWGMALQPDLFMRFLKRTFRERQSLLHGQASGW